MVPHLYMGPVPAFFCPAFQLMDYGVHSGTFARARDASTPPRARGRPAPPCFGVGPRRCEAGPEGSSVSLGVRILAGPNAGDNRISVSQEGMTYRRAGVNDLGSDRVRSWQLRPHCLRALNGGTVRGDKKLADRFLDGFFRI